MSLADDSRMACKGCCLNAGDENGRVSPRPCALSVISDPTVLDPMAGLALVLLLLLIGLGVDQWEFGAQWWVVLLGAATQTLVRVGVG